MLDLLNVVQLFTVTQSLILHVVLVSVVCVWTPLGGGPWRSLFKHSIDLFKGQTLSLWHQEVSVDETGETESSPKEEDT